MRQRSRYAGVVLASGILVMSAAFAHADSETPDAAASEPPTESSITHDALSDVAAELNAYEDAPGFAGVFIDQERKTVTLRWAGEVPAEVLAKSVDRGGVLVEVSPAEYSEEELVRNSGALMRASLRVSGQKRITMVSPTDDRSGLIATVDPTWSLSPKESSEWELSLDLPIPVKYEIADSPGGLQNLSRTDDSPPWQGGAFSKLSATAGHCTTGFAVLTNSGEGRILTAAHCYNVGDTITDGVGQVIGRAVAEQRTNDALLIDPVASPATIGKVFTGPHNSNTFRWVGGATAPTVGESVCASGSVSGERCGSIVQTKVSAYCSDNNAYVCVGFLSAKDGHLSANGDSGGPIFVKRSDGRAGGRGVIAGGINPTACTGTMRKPSPCYSKVFSVGIHKILDGSWNLSIETGS